MDVSVLLPYRDAAATLDEAIESVLAQRGVALELILVDDGSRDDGPARAAAWAARDPRVVLLDTDGVGIARALGVALAAARAPVIARMDGDDWCHPDRLARQLALLQSDPSLVCVGTQVEALSDGDGVVGDGLRRYVAWQNA